MEEEFQRHLKLGRHLHYSHAYLRSVSELEAALAIKPDSNFARLTLARALHGLERTKEARLEVETALRNNPEDADAHYMASFLEPNFERSLISIDSALSLAPLKAEYHVSRSDLLARLARYSEALESARHALVLNPDSASAHRQVTVALFNEARSIQFGIRKIGIRKGLGRSQRDVVAVHVAAALRLEPDNPYSHIVEAHLHFFDREYEASLKKLHEALRLTPNDKYARRRLRKTEAKAKGERFKVRLWNVCFRWMPWPVPLPLMVGLMLWSLWWNRFAFVLAFVLTTLTFQFMIRGWLQLVPDRFLHTSLHPFKKPPLR